MIVRGPKVDFFLHNMQILVLGPETSVGRITAPYRGSYYKIFVSDSSTHMVEAER
jgi:hypothetical protein